MAHDQEQLAALLAKKGSEAKVVKWFADAGPADRKRLAPFCLKWVREQHKRDRELWREDFKSNELLAPAVYAAYACCRFSELKKMGRWVQIGDDLAYDLFRARQPDWLDDWIADRAEQGQEWETIRRLVRDGLGTRPRHDNHIRAMIDAEPAAKVFLDDPELLEEEFWRVFEVPDSVRNESMFGVLDDHWNKLIRELLRKKAINRQRVFDACFAAVNMGFNRERVKFFFKLHDDLKPTLPERLAMFETYCGLLEHPFPTVVQFAFDQLGRLDEIEPQDATCMADALAPMFRQPTKRLVKETLNRLRGLGERDPKAQAAVLHVALGGLRHEKPDIQALSWKFIANHAEAIDTRLAEEIGEVAGGTAPSLRKVIRKWLQEHAAEASASGADEAPAETGAMLDSALAEAQAVPRKLAVLLGLSELTKAAKADSAFIPPCRFNGTELARLPNAEPLTPIATLEELVETAGPVLEDGMLMDDGDRVIEALPRFPVRGDEDARRIADPVVKRAGKLLKQSLYASFVGCGVDVELRALLVNWACTPDEVKKLAASYKEPDEKGPTVGEVLGNSNKYFDRAGFPGFLGLRSREIAQGLYAGESFALVGAATHSGGWIDPPVLVDRVRKAAADGTQLLPLDQILSLLRLAPDHRSRARRKATKLEGEFGAALRYALGDAAPASMKSAGLWVAAARARAPWDDDPLVEKAFPKRGPDAGRAAVYRADRVRDDFGYYHPDSPKPKPHKPWVLNQRVDFSLPTVVAHEHDDHCDMNFGLDTKPPPQSIISRAATVWPIAKEPYFRVDAYSDLAVHLHPLFDPCTPLREMSNLALTCSLGSGYAEQRILAVDVSIAVIEDGRFDAREIGRMLALLVQHANRYTKSLPEVADASPLHHYQTAQALMAMLAHQPKKPPAAFGGLLQVLLDLLEQDDIPLDDPEARAFLESLPGTGKAAKLARRLLAREPEGRLDRAAVFAEAIRGRLAADRQPVR